MSDLGVSLTFNLIDRLSGGMRNIQATVGRVGEAFKTTSRSAEDLNKELEACNKRMENAAFLSLAAGRIEQTAARMRDGVRENIDAIRPLEKSFSSLRLSGVDNIDLIAQRGVAAQRKFAGVSSAAYTELAAGMKHGIKTLSDENVAAVTDAAVATAKATNSQVQQMNSLFTTSYGIFKRLDAGMNDAAWGAKFSASVTAATRLFNITVEDLQQGIRATGSEMTMMGTAMNDQLTLMGMLSKKLGGERSAGALKQFVSQAGPAQEAFDRLGYSIDLIDVEGKLMPMVDFLRSLENEFGANYTAEMGAVFKEAFGSDEAAAVARTLLGQASAFEASAKAMNAAAAGGLTYTYSIAKMADMNFDSVLLLHAQRWNLLRQATGDAMKPLLTALLPVTELFARMAEAVMSVPILGPAIGVIILGVVGLASAFGSLISLMATLYGAFQFLSYAQYFLHARNITLIGGFRTLGSVMLGGLLKGCRAAVVGLWNVAVAGWTAIAPFWPLIAIIAVVAGAAFLIVKFWKPISAFFVSLWEGIEAGAAKLWKGIKFLFGFSPLGMIIKNWDPIAKYFRGLWDKIGRIIERISAPFRHFAAGATAGAMAGAAVATTALPAAAADLGSITPIERTISEARMNSSSMLSAPITINAAPGQSSEDIARTVSRELDARQRASAAQQRARLYDS